ncbi:class I SAM-dependent methyltransferase [Luteimonas soli]|uniref:Class I SAM-dependent methyltransferase n=1 Tax=Luteimonas soli TaxID=1648966 RepID=A0ABV7XLY5_9GAMM
MPDHAHDNAHRQAAWSRYWKQDVLHSLPGSFSGNYAGRIERFWLDSFSDLGSGRRMLDIATGNGPIPQLACTHCAGHAAGMPRIDAIDLAQVAPAWVSSQPATCRDALHFHSGVSAEALPFDDASFDLVTSQYGIEYCDDARTTPEVARVLVPGGRVALLLHHADSRLAQVAREELRLADWLLRPTAFLDDLEAIAPWIRQATTAEGRASLQGNADAHRARDAFNHGMQSLTAEAAASAFPDLLEEARSFAAQALASLKDRPTEDVLAQVRTYRDNLADARLRYAELCECAMDEGMIAAFAARLAAHGLVDITHAPIDHDNGMLMGWTLTARRP